MTQPDLIKPNIRKLRLLLPRLASDASGEVVATVAAIRRTLAARGMDLHDLAAMIGAPGLRPTGPPNALRNALTCSHS
jgi:predicted N-acetyltransferase YhbS